MESSDCESFQRLTKYCKGLTIGMTFFTNLQHVFVKAFFFALFKHLSVANYFLRTNKLLYKNQKQSNMIIGSVKY